jgi:hypothetical protein
MEVAQEALPTGAQVLEAMWATRKLIRSATLLLEVESFDSAVTALSALAASYGGYVADMRASRDADGDRGGSVRVRVPAESFEAAFAALRRLGTVDQESQSTQDVTKEYADLETRLAVKRQAAERLREILRSRTGELSDVLQVERELARVVEEIERLEGERRYYEQQVALSTINVELREPGAVLQRGTVAPIGRALGNSLRVLAESLGYFIYLVAFLLPWLVVAALGWWLSRRVRRWFPKHTTAAPAAESPGVASSTDTP